VWIDRPSAGAEILRDGTRAWTPIASRSIVENAFARELGEDEVSALRLPA
jgi:hypothetical protein